MNSAGGWRVLYVLLLQGAARPDDTFALIEGHTAANLALVLAGHS